MSVSTIGRGGDKTISSPERSPKRPLLGIGLHDPQHGRQACLEFNSFQQGVGQISPWEGLFLFRPLPKRGQIWDIPFPPQSLNDSNANRDLYSILYLTTLGPAFSVVQRFEGKTQAGA